MKTILIPTEEHDAMAAVLATARLVAQKFDSYMEGFAVRPSLKNFVAVEPVSSLTIASAEESDAEMVARAKALFEAFMREHNVPPAGQGGLSWAWVREGAQDDEFVGSYGRVFDLIVLGRPGRSTQTPRMLPLEAALFDSGKPVLIVPPNAPHTTPTPGAVGDNILIAWNASTEQARTITFALPFLRMAKKITVLAVEGWATPGPSAEQAAHHLRMNGIAAEVAHAAAGSRSPGEVILAEASSRGSDLLIKGAYTQSRLRQMIFGGATRHILAHATLPVLMAH